MMTDEELNNICEWVGQHAGIMKLKLRQDKSKVGQHAGNMCQHEQEFTPINPNQPAYDFQ
jgi:hypothetical protein